VSGEGVEFGQLILWKVIKNVATRLKCTRIDFATDPAGGAYSAPQDLLAGFKGPTSKGRGRHVKGRDPTLHCCGAPNG